MCRICLICVNFWHSMRSARQNEARLVSFVSASAIRETARYNSNEKRGISMDCPNCGSPVWECGWCGDFGDFVPLYAPEQAGTPALKDLEQGVLSILEGIQEYFVNGGIETQQYRCAASTP